MARFRSRPLVLGRLGLRANGDRAIATLRAYEARVAAGVPAVMQRSEARMKAAVLAGTPVRSGHMRDNLLSTSDIVEVQDHYEIFWRSQEFLGEINALGEIIQRFYPPDIVIGTSRTAARDMMTPAVEGERPLLHHDLVELHRAAALGLG